MERLIVWAIVLAVAAGSLAALPVAAVGKTFTVNTTADHDDGACKRPPVGDCTLREAIVAANATAAKDTIAFNIAGAGPHVIAPHSSLPFIGPPVIIDGYTEPDARPNTIPAPGPINAAPSVVLSGANAPPGGVTVLFIGLGESVIRGLVINGFSQSAAIVIEGDETTVEGCFIGTDATGTLAAGNASGVDVIQDSNKVRIGGTKPAQRNLISGNRGLGIDFGPLAEPRRPGQPHRDGRVRYQTPPQWERELSSLRRGLAFP